MKNTPDPNKSTSFCFEKLQSDSNKKNSYGIRKCILKDSFVLLKNINTQAYLNLKVVVTLRIFWRKMMRSLSPMYQKVTMRMYLKYLEQVQMKYGKQIF